MLKSDKEKKYKNYYMVILIILPFFSLLVSYHVNMPYDSWLSENLPVWLAIVDYIVFAACFIVMAFPNRSSVVNYFAVFGASVAALFLKQSTSKAPDVYLVILIVAAVFFTIIKSYYRQKSIENNKI